MCGIAGWVAPTASAPEERALQPMLDALYHRGPDGAGSCFYSAERGAYRVALGHRRLAIIDPNGSRQPMRDDAAGLALTFNGEIYNFRELRAELEAHGHAFERDSDTEVLLRAYQQWGTQCVNRLRGQFAFAVWDARAERLFLARDRFGEKPLYLYEANGALYFASEIKALLKLPQVSREVDLSAVWDYLAYRYVPGPRTLLAAIRKLPPASVAIWHRGHLQEIRYWTPPDKFPRAKTTTLANRDTPPAFLAQLGESVELQMVSDVPFGAYLSGGLDSSVVVALMTRYSPKVKTFSVGFDGDRQSELSHAATVAQQFGTEHHEMVVTHRDFIDYLPQLDEYGLIIHDGGTSHYVIHYCPWCGHRLPKSTRDASPIDGLRVSPAEEQETASAGRRATTRRRPRRRRTSNEGTRERPGAASDSSV